MFKTLKSTCSIVNSLSVFRQSSRPDPLLIYKFISDLDQNFEKTKFEIFPYIPSVRFSVPIDYFQHIDNTASFMTLDDAVDTLVIIGSIPPRGSITFSILKKLRLNILSQKDGTGDVIAKAIIGLTRVGMFDVSCRFLLYKTKLHRAEPETKILLQEALNELDWLEKKPNLKVSHMKDLEPLDEKELMENDIVVREVLEYLKKIELDSPNEIWPFTAISIEEKQVLDIDSWTNPFSRHQRREFAKTNNIEYKVIDSLAWTLATDKDEYLASLTAERVSNSPLREERVKGPYYGYVRKIDLL